MGRGEQPRRLDQVGKLETETAELTGVSRAWVWGPWGLGQGFRDLVPG